MRVSRSFPAVLLAFALATAGCERIEEREAETPPAPAPDAARAPAPPAAGPAPDTFDLAQIRGRSTAAQYVANVRFRLRTVITEGKLAFVGVGGAIDGQVNPTLRVPAGAIVEVTLVNGDGAVHDVVFPDFGAGTERVTGRGASSVTVFRVDETGGFEYFCSVPGHREAGMLGRVEVVEAGPEAEREGPDITRPPTAVPEPVGGRQPRTVSVELEAVELEARLADGVQYTYWTFNGTVPGPFVRVRVGDRVEVRLRNHESSRMIHSVDFHAATGPGGGAEATQTIPGRERGVTFRALKPGLYVYHCATPMVANHVSNGMYGLILVEPERGLPAVDREFYVMQGEIYTVEPAHHRGRQEFSVEKLLDERPEYVVFNGAVGALTDEHALQARTGERIRIFFGVGGPNLPSSFHVIGEIFERVHHEGSLLTPPLEGVQTTMVPSGGSTIVELELEVPGRYLLVDHSLARTERGALGFLIVEGEENPEVFEPGVAEQ